MRRTTIVAAIVACVFAGSVPARAVDTLPANRTIRVSVANDESQGNNWSGSNWVNHNMTTEFEANSLSADGRYVVFSSRASNLVAGDTNGVADVFLRDVTEGTTTRVSLDPSGLQYSLDSVNGEVSDDGRYVIFSVGSPGVWPTLYQRDLVAATTKQIAAQAGFSSMTPDGRYVAYTESSTRAFRWDRDTDELLPVSVNDAGLWGDRGAACTSMSADGRYVAFCSWSDNLVPGDTNGMQDVFVRDTQAGSTERISVGSTGAQFPDWSGATSTSGDGRFVAFLTRAGNLGLPGISPDATEVVLRDRQAGSTTLVSTNTLLQPAFDDSNGPMVSRDGRYVVFHSWASNLIAADGNRGGDTFVWDRLLRVTSRVSVGSLGYETIGNGMQGPAISADGRYVLFESASSTLASGDTNGVPDLFLRDRLGELNDSLAPIDDLLRGQDLLQPFQNDLNVAALWSARDVESGLAYFDVSYVRARYDSSSFGSRVIWRPTTLGTAGTLIGSPGYTYCLKVRAKDNRTNLSDWGPGLCTSTPVDDRTMRVSGTWSRRTASSFYRGTYSLTSSRGASLSLAVKVRRLSILVETCTGCGTIDVLFNGTLLKRVSLSSSTTTRRKIISVTRFSSVRSGTVVVRVVSSGKRVAFDGLGVSLA